MTLLSIISPLQLLVEKLLSSGLPVMFLLMFPWVVKLSEDLSTFLAVNLSLLNVYLLVVLWVGALSVDLSTFLTSLLSVSLET